MNSNQLGRLSRTLHSPAFQWTSTKEPNDQDVEEETDIAESESYSLKRLGVCTTEESLRGGAPVMKGADAELTKAAMEV